ncbi:UNVERIFIED_CONTAM: hypothetical protein N8J90_11470 [Halobacillus marinus]|uniref:hypothetical protein n=1 Tax=Bacillaceae TaxID=186817 RepID=UPI0002A50736|nr:MULTISPECIES: hypothetical protein [Bacillaceae]ELK45218.1 hypothetical protein D479_15852 [Halobacillus sp. BAB-2008]QHT46028.1 hypothetical protein M662_05825 [Bacillus sp. SB49]
MVVVVHPSFHWIGYHVCKELLQEGHVVIGIDPIKDKRSDLLYMYVGRNSNFQHFFQKSDKENHMHNSGSEVEVDIKKGKVRIVTSEGEERVEIPALYGEWMPMADHSFQEKGDLRKWIEETEAVYVGDFVKTLLPSYLTRNMEEESLEERVEATWRCRKLLERV